MQVELATASGSYVVTDIKKSGRSILGKPEKIYTVAINSYMLNGGNDYKFNKNNVIREDFGDISEVVIKAFTSGRTLEIDYDEITQENLILR